MSKKPGRNKKKCEAYKLMGKREKNKKLKQERYLKKMAKAKARKLKRVEEEAT